MGGRGVFHDCWCGWRARRGDGAVQSYAFCDSLQRLSDAVAGSQGDDGARDRGGGLRAPDYGVWRRPVRDHEPRALRGPLGGVALASF
eukprot:4375405-Lingulodinium_polyedra.AAC.1